METVFRIQDKDEQGPYRTYGFGFLEHHNGDIENHPTPRNDPKIKRSVETSERCAFESLDSLLQWFTEEEIEMLERLGYEVVMLKDVFITMVGAKQVLFQYLDETETISLTPPQKLKHSA